MIRVLADSLLQPRTRSWSATEAMRSMPDSQAELVRIASKPHEAAEAARSGLSVQSSIAAGAVARPQRSSTRWSIGLPPMSVITLSGRRLDSMRAGTATMQGRAIIRRA